MMKIKAAVRADLEKLAPGDLVMAACSGGADSMGLTMALIDEAKKLAIKVAVVSVDHQLQTGSGERSRAVADFFSQRGADSAQVITVDVGNEGGPEGAARVARYQALNEQADRLGAVAIYLGHTASDQAETVLLGLARGSGARSLSAMAGTAGRYRRPLLHLTREQVRQEVMDAEIPVWDDPHNQDPRFTRVRARQLMPILEKELGPGIESALVRSAALLRADADALDQFAADAGLKVIVDGQVDLVQLMLHPKAVRTRVIKQYLEQAGVSAVTADHLDAVEALASRWKGQGPVALPGNVDAAREGALLTLRPRV